MQYQQEEITLYSTDGRVIPIREFTETNLHLLNEEEQRLVAEHLWDLPTTTSPLEMPLVRTEQYFNGVKKLQAKRGGGRSAYLPEIGLKIKACNPQEACFPEWKIDEQFNLNVAQIPFGVMTAVGIMREILGYCFFKHHNMPLIGEPIAVLEYKPNGTFMNYALVSKIQNDLRVEAFIDCRNYTLRDLINSKKQLSESPYLGQEANLVEIDKPSYVDEKTNLLIALNFNGGFRGILNSNIGNDVITAGKIHSICDLDTFSVVKLPGAQEVRQMRHFVIRCFLELIKSSLPFIEYLDFKEWFEKDVHWAIAAYYRNNSSLYSAYRQKFLAKTTELGWQRNSVEKFIDEAFQTKVSFELLKELIPNSHTLAEFKVDSHYVPHN